ncbi:hypothetical protein DM558_02955 [Entomomonas moraniae]|uniref:Glycosylase n=1 Tax=Entomomonas moraniae TaxID=2213226 RepID=A0A3Q9JHL5_9GAMM|nr:hypothetical protein [Entomomonas moraniae]AZS49802.1 hypothetical protein DM558_02955 [Entomomonas moraniae]
MIWEKKGLILKSENQVDWIVGGTLQPTPILLGNIIRIYFGGRSVNGISRVGYVDVDAACPSNVLQISEKPVLDIGAQFTFDENGVVPCAVVKHEEDILLYYAGYQVPENIKFLVFGGLAVSKDGGKTFFRNSQVPITDRTDGEEFFRVIHSIMFEDGKWRAWYGGGNSFIDKKYPVYDIRYMESECYDSFPKKGKVIIQCNEGEHRVGRPYVFKDGNIYRMFFGASTKLIPYKLAYAESKDGINWTRDDDKINLEFSSKGWDSKTMGYPSVLRYESKTYCFYTGNNMGADGFGYAELVEW